MATEKHSPDTNHVPWWQPMLFASLAGGMAWGIRGQYGHETGAMIAGVLVSLTLIFLLCPGISSLQAVRAAALCTIAMGIGGTMTYGQTVGLSHDQGVVGNWGAWRWGMIGLAVKGGVWIGLAGFFLGLGLGGKRYGTLEMMKLLLFMLGASLVGWSLLNRPHDPDNLRLPFLYFSDHWQWEPELLEQEGAKYRPEIWGALAFALLTAIIYVSRKKHDSLARNMALWGLLAGGLGFPLGQCLQSSNAWNPGFYSESFLAPVTNYFNWWNAMETGFGVVMGAVLGLGLWLNRHRIDLTPDPDETPTPYWLEGLLLAVHLPLLYAVNFIGGTRADALYDFGLIMAFIPLVACIRGRYWPYLQLLPITLLPIAGKTASAMMTWGGKNIEAGVAFSFFFLLPMISATAFAAYSARKESQGDSQHRFIRDALLFTTWIYFWLNYAFFDFPWPWIPWGGRTVHGLFFLICALGISGMVYAHRKSVRGMPLS